MTSSSHVRSDRQRYDMACRVTRERELNVAEKYGSDFFCTRRTAQANDFELILTVKMETRHPEEGYFGNAFRAICNHCGVLAARSRKTWKFVGQFLRFLKTTLYGEILKICSESFHHGID